MNFSGGLLSELSLIPHLSLQTGFMVSRQHFSTHNENEVVFDHLTKLEGNHSSASVLANSRRVELVGLDVPFNFQYQYGNLSLTAGISTLAYIQERFSHQYSVEYIYVQQGYSESSNIHGERNTFLTEEKVTRSESFSESYDPLQQVDLANMLNLSLGYHFTFDRSQLVVEPFVKHPLGDLTSRDIRFGARGMRLKFQF